MADYLPEVRNQYENYPYPIRDPNDEKYRLLTTTYDSLVKLNHYCFNGRIKNHKNFAALVAGGGTGDGLIYLADQLKDIGHVTYVDLSSASMEIAQERAKVRGLSNITWIQGSLLDLAADEVGFFDYINCSGVLHHLEDPTAGLKALKSLLKPHGCMGIMVYAKYGRTGVYQIQDLMRIVNSHEADIENAISNTQMVLDHLPETNWFMRAKGLQSDHKAYGPTGIYDLFLHAQDRAYSIPELKAWLDECGMEFIEFADTKEKYDPRSYINDDAFHKILEKQNKWDKYAIAELITGDIRKHVFYCGLTKNTTATLSDNSILIFYDETLYKDIIATVSVENFGREYLIKRNDFLQYEFPITPETALLFQYINGKNSFGQIKKKVERKLKPDKQKRKQMHDGFRRIINSLIKLDEIYLSLG